MTNPNSTNYFNELTGTPILDSALQQSRDSLQAFANDPNFQAKMEQAFGEDSDGSQFQQAWAEGDFGAVPNLKILPASEINNALGAYAAETETIYLSQELIDQYSADAISRVFLEEYGHYLDTQLTDTEAPGDEGAMFAEIIRKGSLSKDSIEILQRVQDTSTSNIDGKNVQLENIVVPVGGQNFKLGEDDWNYIVKKDQQLKEITNDQDINVPNNNASGVAFLEVGSKVGTGALLNTGKYVITAKHVIADKINQESDIKVTFEKPSNGEITTITASNIKQPKAANTPFFGTDLAIVELEKEAPNEIQRYTIKDSVKVRIQV